MLVKAMMARTREHRIKSSIVRYVCLDYNLFFLSTVTP